MIFLFTTAGSRLRKNAGIGEKEKVYFSNLKIQNSLFR